MQRGCTVCLSTDELPDKPPCSRSEVGAREVMEREISHAPGHGQARRRRIEQATPRRERLEMPDTEQVAQVHVEGEASCLPPPRGVQGLGRKLKPGTMRKQPKEV